MSSLGFWICLDGVSNYDEWQSGNATLQEWEKHLKCKFIINHNTSVLLIILFSNLPNFHDRIKRSVLPVVFWGKGACQNPLRTPTIISGDQLSIITKNQEKNGSILFLITSCTTFQFNHGDILLSPFSELRRRMREPLKNWKQDSNPAPIPFMILAVMS